MSMACAGGDLVLDVVEGHGGYTRDHEPVLGPLGV
jgi:hypothetical protein